MEWQCGKKSAMGKRRGISNAERGALVTGRVFESYREQEDGDVSQKSYGRMLPGLLCEAVSRFFSKFIRDLNSMDGSHVCDRYLHVGFVKFGFLSAE